MLALGAVWLALFWPVLIGGLTFFYRDVLITTLPTLAYAAERLRHGELPQWYPNESLGVPLIGQVATGHFHPFTFLLLPLDVLSAVNASLALGFLLSSIGAYRLARGFAVSRPAALAAAFAFAYGGFAFGVSNVRNYSLAFATLPWVARFARELMLRPSAKRVVFLAVSWSLVFFAGDAQGFLCCGIFLAFIFAAPGPRLANAARFVGAAALALALTAIDLIPSYFVSRDSLRVQGTANELILTWSLAPLRLFEFFVGNFIDEPERAFFVRTLFGEPTGRVFVTSVFFGVIALLCLLYGLKERPRDKTLWIFGGVALLGVLLALGPHTPLGALLRLPLLQRFRYPEKLVGFFWLGALPFVALGAERLRAKGALLLAASLLFFVGVCWLAQPARWLFASFGEVIAPELGQRIDDQWLQNLLPGALLLLLLAVLVVKSRWAVPALLLVDLLRVSAAYAPMISREALATPPFVTTIKSLDEGAHTRAVSTAPLDYALTIHDSDDAHERWAAGVSASLVPNACGLFGVTCLGENLGASSVRHHLAIGRPWVKPPPLPPELFAACWHVEKMNQEALESVEALGLSLRRSDCRPRGYLSATLPTMDMYEDFARARDLGVQPPIVSWEDPRTLEAGQGSVTWKRFDPELHIASVQSDRETALVHTEAFSTGWTASIDGHDTPIIAALVDAQAIALPAGEHTVEFRYRTPGLAAGAVISLFAILLCMLLVMKTQRRVG